MVVPSGNTLDIVLLVHGRLFGGLDSNLLTDNPLDPGQPFSVTQGRAQQRVAVPCVTWPRDALATQDI